MTRHERIQRVSLDLTVEIHPGLSLEDATASAKSSQTMLHLAEVAINAADATREPVAQRECKDPNVSTKQWLITTVEHHFYQVFDLFDSMGFKDTEERWQYMRRFERAMKLIKQGPDEPTP